MSAVLENRLDPDLYVNCLLHDQAKLKEEVEDVTQLLQTRQREHLMKKGIS